MRDAHVGLFGKPVVGPRQDDHAEALRVGLEVGQRPTAGRLHLRQAVELPPQREGEGLAGAPPGNPHLRRRRDQRRLGRLEAGGQVQQRGQQACAPLGQPPEALPERGAQVVGLPLDQGADLGLGARGGVLVGDRLEVREEDDVQGRVGAEQRVEKAVCELDRVAEGRPALVDPLPGGGVRQNRVEPDPAEEVRIERVERVDQQAAVQPDPPPAAPVARRHPVALVDELLAQAHQVERRDVVVDVVAQVVEAVAGAAEGVLPPVDLHDGNRAAAVALLPAPLAGERLAVGHLPPGQGVEIERPFRQQALFDAGVHLERDAEGPHQAGLRRDDDRFADEGRHGERHGAVVADAALHEDLLAHRAVALDPVGVVHADRVDQPGHDVLAADALVDRVLDVRRDEGRALVVEVGRPVAPQRRLRDLLHAHAERLEGALLEKGPGPGRAGLVHGVVGGHRVGERGVLGVLAADFEDRVDRGVEVDGGGGVRDDLVDDAVGQGMQTRDLPPGPGHAQAGDADAARLRLPAQLREQGAVAAARGPDRVAAGAQVLGGQQRPVGAPQQNRLGRGRAHVQAEDARVAGPDPSALQRLEIHLRREVPQGRQAIERGRPLHEQALEARERRRLVVQRPQRRAQRLEARGLVRHDQPRHLPAQVLDHHRVLRAPAHDHDVAALDPLEQLEDLVGHHPAQPGRDPRPGDPLVGGVRAVGFAEHGAPAGNGVGGLDGGEARGVREAHVHAPQLLQEELPGARGALVAGRDVGDAPRAVQDVDHEGLPAGRDHGRAVHSRGLQEGIRPLDGLRLGDRCQVDELPEPAAGGCDAVDGGEVGLRQRPLQGALGVALMGVQRAADDPGARLAGRAGPARPAPG